MYDRKRTINGKAQKPATFTVFIHHEEDRVEGKRRFSDPVEANSYFKELCRSRTVSPASVVGVAGHDMKKYFRIDQVCDAARALLDLDWVSTD